MQSPQTLSGNSVQNALRTNLTTSLHTGNMVFDMMIATLISSILASTFQMIPTVLNWISEKITDYFREVREHVPEDSYRVTIMYRTTLQSQTEKWVVDPADKHNRYLFYAISAYLRKHVFEEGNLQLTQQVNVDNIYERMKKSKLECEPRGKVTVDDVEFEITYTQNTSDSRTTSTYKATLTSSKYTTDELNGKLQEMYNEYVQNNFSQYEELEDEEEKEKVRWYYNRAPRGNCWNRYVLKTTRKSSFDQLFIPHKKQILSVINNTSPDDKLAIFLHGDPGCGKTSFIRALAAHLKRSIVNLRLSSFDTNSELIEVLHSTTIRTTTYDDEGYEERQNLELPIEDRIYVFEDIDADKLDVIKRRVQKGEMETYTYRDKKGRKRKGKRRVQDPDEGYKSPDQLSLSGILNLLQGVLEIPGGVFVLTSNHPEKLDPALLRPGRMDLNIELKKMRKKEINQLLRYHGCEGEIEFEPDVHTPAFVAQEVSQYLNVKRDKELFGESDSESE